LMIFNERAGYLNVWCGRAAMYIARINCLGRIRAILGLPEADR
jgi:hypothetical protein